MLDDPELGFNVHDIDSISPRWKCFSCQFIIRKAHQLTGCGHRLCESCLKRLLRDPNATLVMCPLQDCGETTEIHKIRHDKAFQRELDPLIVKCFYHDRCSWEGPLKEYQFHLDSLHNIFTCRFCQQTFKSQKDLDIHETTDCKQIFTNCPLGSYCQNTKIHHNDMQEHLISFEHQDSMMKLFQNVIERAPHVYRRLEAENLAEEREFAEKFMSELKNLLTLVDAATDGIRVVKETQFQSKVAIENLITDFQKLANIMVERVKRIEAARQYQQTLQNELEFLHQFIETFQTESMNGTLLWRIDNVSKIIQEAQSEHRPWIVSPDFHSSACGYRMRIRLFPYGDGHAKRTHMSVFFMLVKGEYDAILMWPFSYRINFCLLDQVTEKHVIDSFLPDAKSTSFQRPQTEANIPNGIPKFVSLSTIQQEGSVYVREDTMYLKVFVDFTCELQPTPESLLTMNLALPSHFQENIQREHIINQKNSEKPMIMMT